MVRAVQLVVLLVAAGMLAGCPNPATGKTDPWLTAKTIINQSKMGVPVADVIFTQWKLSQTDQQKVAEAEAKYVKIKLAVLNGLSVAYDGVVIAEQAKTDPDMSKLMDQAETAWQDLRKFLEDLLKKPEEPASQPVAKAKTPLPTPTVQPVVKLEDIDLSKLPKSLLPKK